ncbi:hypothetical protein NQ318_022273 [Aromia moschata]|uniref:Innexin n=1 Tax=Aromia moschata TaxID=1265417 RepID=A0AAV8Z4F5_9CUCU|nr:hypothetical protein NQ318_022273 [Aromia moschata]
MIDVLKSFKSLIKLEQVHTDNNVFKLHYKVTVIMLLAFSILLTNGLIPGLGLPDKPSDVSRQGYYQWVCIVFVVQALIFYFPRYLWKTWEGGRLRLLLSDITNIILRYVLKDGLGQIHFLDWLITGNFSMYGIAYAMYNHVNPMNSVFPKVTKCTFHKFGPSGTRQNFDGLCILPLNILNEKFFLILWYWLFLLLFVSFCALIYRALFLFVPKFRVYLLRAQTRSFERGMAQTVVDNISYGDFFVLYKIGKNLNPIMYKELVQGMHDYIVHRNKNYKSYPVGTDEV